MKILIWALIPLLFGCAGHYYEIRDRSLYIYLKSPDAREVLFANSQDDFRFHRAEQTGSGIWMSKVPIHTEFRYFYQIDGNFFLPDCRFRESDDFGSENCIYIPDL